MRIVIPMAGYGRRFSDAGYDKIKPLIDVRDIYSSKKSMIERVAQNFNFGHGRNEFIFILNGSTNNSDLIDKIHKLNIDQRIVSIVLTNGPTRGAAETALFAEKYIDESSLIITNCDQIIDDYNGGLDHFCRTNDIDAALGAFISTSPKNSYMSLDENGYVNQVKEKVVISNIATNGVHFWLNGLDFVRSAKEMIAANDLQNGEFYIAPTFNYLINKGKRVKPFFYNYHYPIGTPEDLKRYEDIQTK